VHTHIGDFLQAKKYRGQPRLLQLYLLSEGSVETAVDDDVRLAGHSEPSVHFEVLTL